MRRWTPGRRNTSKLPINSTQSTQYQLDFLDAVCYDGKVKSEGNDAVTPLPPNHSRGDISAMTNSHTTTAEPLESTPKRQTYPQDWPAYNAAQTSEKDTLKALLGDLCATIPQAPYAFGRPSLPMSDMVYTAALKVYSGFSSRRFNCDVEEAQRKGHIDVAPSFASVNRTIANPDLTPILESLIGQSAAPLREVESQFAVDSSGFSICRFDRWFDHKWGKEKSRRQWLKAHIAVGTKTNIVTAIKITQSNVADITEFTELVDKTSEYFNVKEVSADKAYLSEKNLRHIEAGGAKPFIPFKLNTTGRGSAMWRRLYANFILHEETFKAHYHRRSNVETVFSMVKGKFGDSVRAKSETGQVNEILLKFLCHNICVLIQEMHELGITSSFRLETETKIAAN